MAVNLETIVLELKADDKQLKQDINTSVSNARQQLQKLENIPISLDVDISPIKKKINEINKKGISIDVDHSPLVELNNHLDKKKQHLTLLQAYFNSHPLTPSVDFDQLQNLKNEFNNLKSEHDKLRGQLNSNPLTPTVDVSNLQQLINQLNNLKTLYNNTQSYINSNALAPTVDVKDIKKLVNKLNNLLAEYDGTQQNFDSNPLTPAIDVNNLERLINQLNIVIKNYDSTQQHFNSNPLTPTIDIKGLEQFVNELHNVIKEYDNTQQHFNANPLTPTIDTINLQQLVNEFHGVTTEHDATQQHFNSNPLTPKADTSEIERIINNLNELENHNNKTIELNFDAAANIGVEEFTDAIQQGAYEGTQEAQGGGGIFGRINDIITGTFEGFGEEVSKDFYKGFSNKFRKRVTNVGSATEKYAGSRGKKIGESLIKNVGNYVGIDDFLKDIDVVGNAIDNFLDPQQFSKRLKNFENNIVEALINIQGSSKIQPFNNKNRSYVKNLPKQPLQEALDGNNNQEAIKYLRKAFTPPTEPIRRAATRAAGVGIKAASQPFRIRKRVKLAESAQEIERQQANAEVFPEGIAKDAKSLTLSMGGIDFQKGAPNSEFSHNLASKLFPGTVSKPVYNTEAQELSGKEWTVQIRRVLGELRSEGNSQIKEQLTVVERIIQGLQGFVEGLDDQTKQQTYKAPENPLLQRIYAAMQRSGVTGMSKQDVDEITSATPVDKILEAAIQTGSYPDAVKIATEAAANKEKYPNKPINVTGSSGGGYIVEEVIALLERMGYTNVKGVGLMSAPVGNTRTASAKNYRSYIGTGDYVAHATYGKRHIKDKDTDYAVKKALQATHNEYPFLKFFEGLFSPDTETTKIMTGSGISHQLPTTLADSELAPDLEEFLQQGKVSEDFKNVQAKTEIKDKDDISSSDIKKYIIKELGVQNEKEIKTGLQERYRTLSTSKKGKRDPLKRFLESEYGKKEKDRNANIENIDLREKENLYKIYKKIAESKVQQYETRGTRNFDFFRIMKDNFEGSFAPLPLSVLASFKDPETINRLTPGEIQASNTQNTPHRNVKKSPQQQQSLQETLYPPFSFIEHGLSEEEQKEKIKAIKAGTKNIRKKEKLTSGEVGKYAEQYIKFRETFLEELEEFYKSGEPLIHSLKRAQDIGEFKQEKQPLFPSLKDYTPQSPEQQANLKFLQDEERDVEAIRRSIGASFADPASLQEVAQGEFTFADPKRQDPDKLRIFDELLQHKEYLQGQLSGKIREHGEEYLKFIRQFREELAAFHFGHDKHPIGESLAQLKELKEPKRSEPLSPEAEEISISQWRTMGENTGGKLPGKYGKILEGISNEQLVDIMQKTNKTLDEITDKEKNKIKKELNEITTKAKAENQKQLQSELEKQRKPKKEKSKNTQQRVIGEHIDDKLPIQHGRKPVGFSNERLFSDIIQKPKNKRQVYKEQTTNRGEILVEKLVDKLTEQLQKIIDNNIQQWQAVESQYKTIESQYELIQQEIKEVKKALQPETSGSSESQNQQQTENNKKQTESKQQQIKSTENTEKHKQSETAASVIDPEEIKQRIKGIEKKFEEPYQDFLKAIDEGNIKLAEEYAKTFKSVGARARKEIDKIAQQYKEITGNKGIEPGSVGQTQGSVKGRLTQKEKQVDKNLKKEQQRLQREANEQQTDKSEVENLPQDDIKSLIRSKEIADNWFKTKKHIIEGLKEVGSASKEEGYKIQKNISEGSPGITQKIRQHWEATTNSIKNNINTLQNRTAEFAQSTRSAVGNSFESLENKVNSFAQSTRNAINNINPLGEDEENLFAGIKEKLKNLDIPQFIGDAILTLGTVEGFEALSEKITTLGKSAIDAFLKMERLKIGLSFSNTNVDKTLESIKEQTDRLGISFINAAKGYKSFSSATEGTKLENQTEKIFSGFAQSISAMQLGGERQKRVYTAISQIASKGVVSTEELRLQLGEQLPVAFNAAARAMGMTVQEFNKLVSSGNVLSEDLLPKLAQQLQIETRETAKKSIGTLTFELQKLKNTIFEMQASTGKELAGFITPVVSNMNKLVELIKNNSDLFVSLSASLLAVGSARVLTRFTALASHFVDLKVLTKKVLHQLPKIKKGLRPIGKTIKTFGLQVAALAGAIAAVRVAWQQAHLHQTEFDKGAANVADTLREVNNNLGNTSDKIDEINNKELKIGGLRGWLDKALGGLDRLDKKASSVLANVLPGNKEFWRTDISTAAEAKASHLKIDSTRQNYIRSQLLNTLGNQINNDETMDKMVSQLKRNNEKQKAVEAALISTEGDTAKEEQLRKRQNELVNERRKIITDTIPGGKQTLKEQIDALKGQIDKMKGLHGSEVAGADGPLNLTPQIERSKQQLKSLQKMLDETNIHLEMASREANILANQFEKLDSSFENKTFNTSAKETQAKQQVHKGYLEGELNKEQYEQELNKIELRHQQTRLQNLRKYQEKYKNVFEDLNQVDRASLKKLLDGKKIEKAGIGDLKQAKGKAKEGDVSSNVKAALNRAIQIRNRTQEIENLENQILTTKIQQREESGGIKDVSEKIRDEMQKLKEARKQHQEKQKELINQNKDLVKESDKFGQSIRDFIRSTKEQLINIEKQIKDTKKENAKLSIKNELSAIGGEVSNLFGSFEDVFGESVAAQKKFDTTKQQKALTRLEAEQKTIDIARKIKDFQDQRKEIVKRGNKLRKQYLENERKYEQTKAEHWQAILKQHKKVQDQVGAIGKGMHKTAKGIIEQGNNLLKALHAVATNINNTSIGSGSTSGSGNLGNLDNIGEALFEAIIGKESSGNYKAVNPDTGALGLGQVMPSNVASWTKEALGESLSPQEFLNDKQAQIDTIEHKLSQYYSEALEKAGGNQEEAIRRVASKWYSGREYLFDDNTNQGDYPSIRDYTLDILDRIKNNVGSALGGNVGEAAEKARQFVQNDTSNNNRVENVVSQVMNQLKNQAGSITFPVAGQSARDNLVGPGGMMDSYRNRGPGRPNRHNGIDYAYATGTPLQAPISGTVQSVYSDKGEYGVRIQGQNEKGENVVVALNHLHSITENLKQGAQLQAGQKIGTVGGDQGSWGSTGSHLDLKVKINGQYVDPRDFFGKSKGAVSSQVQQQTQQQVKAQISDFEPISLNNEEPVDISTNIPEFSPINPLGLEDLPEFKNRISDSQQQLSEATQRQQELQRQQQNLQIRNKIESIQTDIRDKIRETQHEIEKSREETTGLIRNSGTVLTNEQKILEEREEISSKFDGAIRQRRNEIRQAERQLEAEKERLKVMQERVQNLEDSDRKTQLQETIELMKQSISTQEEQINSAKEEIKLLEDRKPKAIKENIELKRRELELQSRSFRTGIETEALDTEKSLLSTQDKSLYKQAEIQKESALMQERLSHAEKILEIEKTIKDEQRQQELINLANQAHENRVAQIEAEKQQQIEQANRKKQKFTGNMQADLLQARAKATEFNPYKQAELEGEAKLIQHKLDTSQRKKELEEQIKLLDLNAQEAEKLRNQFQQLNQLKLNRIKEESNLLGQQIKNITQKGFSTLFDSFAKVIRGTKSMGEAFRDFGLTVLKQISKIATKNLTNAVMGGIFGGGNKPATATGGSTGGGILGSVAGGLLGGGGGIGSTIGGIVSGLFYKGGEVPNFARGGEVDKAFGEGVGNIEDYLESENVNEIRNFATGGLIEAMKKEKAAGGKPVPIVASAGEQVLPTKNGDAQFFREIQKKGLWEELKNGAIGTLGNIKDVISTEQPTRKIENYNSGGIVNNKQFSTNNVSNNAIKNKMDWTKPSFDAQALRSKTNWASQPMVSTSRTFESTQKTQSSNMRGENTMNINTPITVVAPKPEAYRKSAKQIASEQERQTQRAYKRFS